MSESGKEVSASSEPHWERSVLEKLAFESLKEQRRRRRWGIFFKLLGFAYAGVVVAMIWGAGHHDKDGKTVAGGGRHTALVELEGAIGAGGQASAEVINSALNDAFADAGTAGVILHINSPGGSPVQSGIINDEIGRLRKLHPNIPLYVVVEDICASGGYYIAAAADKIFVDKASIVGSIGVRMDGFGFTELMQKVGVERRSLTAGKNKAFLDPFLPQSPEQVEFAHAMLDEIHQQFIDVVRKGRGKRLKETPDMFSGLFWSGAKSIELGLADGYGTVDSVARDVIKAEDVRDFTQHENFAERVAKRFGASVMAGFGSDLNAVHWR
ncbi:S49 family peptidase [Uliginosibacterium sediminicola]|uniref:S49 family peptidase n=1 Tax=Uliginosibacterium sediminicola TaxID=2024550 RepID=A0ABU9YZQ6_9RHOO